MDCSKKGVCYNFPDKCERCKALSNVINHYPCLQEKGISEAKYTKEDLKIMQGWSLARKIQVTQTRIMEWYMHYEGKVYVSFSGGKDSTVLLDLARRIYPDIPAVFIDTGLEYPSIRSFVKSKENVIWLLPEMNFKQVIETYGYPVISKEVSQKIYDYRRNPNGWTKDRFDENSDYIKRYGKAYCFSKWIWLRDSDIPVSHQCCNVMKKKPAKKFEKETGLKPIVATMAEESRNRRTAWLNNGCNAFEGKRPTSQPMSFWTEQDVLTYLKQFNIPYADDYGEIIEEGGKLKTTGLERTGCMFCMFGAHLEDEPNRFQRMKETYPKQYDFCLRPIEENGLGCRRVMDFVGIKYD